MFYEIAIAATLAMPVTPAGCGTYDATNELSQVTLLSDGGVYASFRDELGLTEQPTAVSRTLEQDSTVCQPLVDHFVVNMATLADSARLDEHGWYHRVMTVGAYRVILVVPMNPPGASLAHRSYLFFFDSATGTFVTRERL